MLTRIVALRARGDIRVGIVSSVEDWGRKNVKNNNDQEKKE